MANTFNDGSTSTVAAPTIDIDDVQVYTDADLLVLYRNGLATGIVTYRAINGRIINITDIDKILKTIEWLENRIANATTNNRAYADFGD